MDDVELLGLGVLGIRVLLVGDDDLVVGDARVTQVLCLGRALVAEANKDDGLAIEVGQVGIGVVVAA